MPEEKKKVENAAEKTGEAVGKSTHLQVKLSNQASEDLGFKKRFRSSTVCMPISLVSAVGDVIMINKTLNELSKNPEISECIDDS